MVLTEHLPLISDIVTRFPKMRILVDHLAVLPFCKLPQAAGHLDDLLALGCTWHECVTSFTEERPRLTGPDLELVKGRAVRG